MTPAISAEADPASGSALDDPLAVRGQFPLALPFLDLTPRSAFLLPEGSWRLDLGLAYENTMAMSADLHQIYDTGAPQAAEDGTVTRAILEQVAAASRSHHAYYVDGENLRAAFEGALGLSPKIELDVTVPVLWRTPGWLDSTIEQWHSFWGLPDGGRPPFARGQYVIGYADGGETVFVDDAGGGIRLGDVVLGARFALHVSKSGTSAIAATAELKLPTGDADRLDGSGAADAGIGLSGSWRRGRSSFHAGAEYCRLGRFDPAPDLVNGHRASAFAAWNHRVGAVSSFVGQVLAGDPMFHRRDGGDLGDPTLEIALGMRHLTGPRSGLEWALLENLTSRLNTPDVGAFFGWSYRSAAGSVAAAP